MNYLEIHKAKFEKLFDLYMDWNSKINLSAIRDREGVWEKHFEDSLLIHEFFDVNDKTLLDIGAGGGFPTLPLAITTNAKITALDSVGKKMKVIADIVKQLELENVQTKHGRFEDFGHDETYREQFDVVTARAVAPWNILLEYALPFVKVGGSFIAYQGPGILEALELETIEGLDCKKLKGVEKKLGGRIVRIEKIVLGENERYFVEVQKVTATIRKYPRGNGIPRQDPL